MIVSTASSVNAVARWIATTSGGSSSFTVTAPSSACTISSGSDSTASMSSSESRRCATNTQIACAIISSPTIAAAERCEYSMMAVRSKGG